MSIQRWLRLALTCGLAKMLVRKSRSWFSSTALSSMKGEVSIVQSVIEVQSAQFTRTWSFWRNLHSRMMTCVEKEPLKKPAVVLLGGSSEMAAPVL